MHPFILPRQATKWHYKVRLTFLHEINWKLLVHNALFHHHSLILSGMDGIKASRQQVRLHTWEKHSRRACTTETHLPLCPSHYGTSPIAYF